MSLKITAANKPITVKQLVLVVYSLPGIGKTTLSETCDRPLLLDFDKGAYRAQNRKDVVEVESWADVASMKQEDLTDYATIVIDTAGRALDFLSTAIIAENPKNARGSGDLTLQGFGVLKGRFISILKQWRTFGKDVVLLAHMDEKQEGDIIKERLDVQGGSKTEIYKCADAIGKLYIAANKRKLDFSPREGSLGKNPAQLDVLDVPDFRKEPEFMAGVIQNIKNSINKLSEEQKAEVDAIEGWRTLFHACKTAADFNSILPKAKGASQVVKMLLMAEATTKGLKFDREGMQFYAAAAAPPPKSDENLDADPLAPNDPQTITAEDEQVATQAPTDLVITAPQLRKLQALRRERGIPEAQYRELLGRNGYEHSNEIQRKHFDAILAEVAAYCV